MENIDFNPYLFFRGDCRQAMEFYKDIFGGELVLQTNGELNMASEDRPADNIMHAMLKGGDVTLMGSDTPQASAKAAKVTLCFTSSNALTKDKLTRIFEKLSQDVKVEHPLKKEFWGDTFGSVVDKFGIEWMVSISENQPS